MLLILSINRSRLSSFIMNLLHLMPLLIWSCGHKFYPVKGQDLETKTRKICPLCPKGYQRKNVEKNVLCDPSSPASDHSHIDMSKCTRCPPNHYQHLISSGVCSPCPPNTFTDNTIITQNCTATTEQLTECPPGNFKRDSDGRCVSCCPSECTNFNWFKQCYKSYQQCRCSNEDDVKKFSKELGLNFTEVKGKGVADTASEAVAGDNNKTNNATRNPEGYQKNKGEHEQDNIIWILVGVVSFVAIGLGLVMIGCERRFRWSTKIWNHARTTTATTATTTTTTTTTMEMQSSSSNDRDVLIEMPNESDPLLHSEYTQKDDDENAVTTVAIADEKSITDYVVAPDEIVARDGDCATSTTTREDKSVQQVTTAAIADGNSIIDYAVEPEKTIIARDGDCATSTTTREDKSVQHLDLPDENVNIFGDPRNNFRSDSMGMKRKAASTPYLDVHARNCTPDELSESRVSENNMGTPLSAFSKLTAFSGMFGTSNTPTPDNLNRMPRRGSTPGNSSNMSDYSSSCNSSRVSTPDGFTIEGKFVIDNSNITINNSNITIHNYGDQIIPIRRGSHHGNR